MWFPRPEVTPSLGETRLSLSTGLHVRPSPNDPWVTMCIGHRFMVIVQQQPCRYMELKM